MTPTVTDEAWIEALDLVVGALEDLPLPEVQARCLLARSKFEAVEVRRLASEVTADGDDGRARRLAKAGGGRSKRAARAAAIEPSFGVCLISTSDAPLPPQSRLEACAPSDACGLGS